MLDRKRITIIVAAAALVLAAIAIVVAMLAINQQPEAASSTPAGHAAHPKASTSPTPYSAAGTEQIPEAAESDASFEAFTPELQQLALNVGGAALTYQSPDTAPEVRVQQYKWAGMSDELAETFNPVWAEIIPADRSTSVTPSATIPRLNSVTGEPGHRTFRVGMEYTFRGKSAQVVGVPATWWFTIDEATQKVVKIEQPAPADLQVSDPSHI